MLSSIAQERQSLVLGHTVYACKIDCKVRRNVDDSFVDKKTSDMFFFEKDARGKVCTVDADWPALFALGNVEIISTSASYLTVICPVEFYEKNWFLLRDEVRKMFSYSARWSMEASGRLSIVFHVKVDSDLEVVSRLALQGQFLTWKENTEQGNLVCPMM